MDKKILRVIDANYNRGKEGLRVIEDSLRFVFEDDALRRRARNIRHALKKVVPTKTLQRAIKERDADSDLGKKTDSLERQRKNTHQIVYASLARVKESLRVLEEFSKLIAPQEVNRIKKLRYAVYTLEKKILIKYGPDA